MGRLRLALALNVSFLVVEVFGAWAFSSLALAADAAHLFSDIGALGLAMLAAHMATRPADSRRSYGLVRGEVLAALANGVLLLGVTAWVTLEAFRRIGSPGSVHGGGLALVGLAGVAVNGAATLVLWRAEHADLNLRAATLHMAADMAGSLAATAAGVAIVVWNAHWADPAASLAISALVVAATWRLMAETVNVLLEGTPRGIDPHQVEQAIRSLPGVEGVHHLHVWSLSSGVPALSGHVVSASDVRLHDAQALADAARRLVSDRFAIRHATFEMECHDCEVEKPVNLGPTHVRLPSDG